jgi:DNA (cytosine-5)-methyltransferase 1
LNALALYNEIDPKAAAWLRELIRQGHIAPGDVSETSIEDLNPDDLRRYTQVHFFAGIGVWSYALRRAGWPDSRPVWTGSCPCQPFSAAGKGGGFADERHLWPHFHWLISQCRPDVVFGEQVASKDGLAWIDLVQADLEGAGYANGAVDFCSAGVGAPHIRQRLYWFGERRLADSSSTRLEGRDPRSLGFQRPAIERNGESQFGRMADTDRSGSARQRSDGWGGSTQGGLWGGSADSGSNDRLADTQGFSSGAGLRDSGSPERRKSIFTDDGPIRGLADADHYEQRAGRNLGSAQSEGLRSGSSERGDAVGMADTPDIGRFGWRASEAGDEPGTVERPARLRAASTRQSATGPTNGFWGAADWLHCRDAKWRPVEPGTFPLAHGAAARVGRLRGYGNAVNAVAAQIFIESYLETKALTIDDDGRDFRLTAEYDLTTDSDTQQDIFS